MIKVFWNMLSKLSNSGSTFAKLDLFSYKNTTQKNLFRV